MKIPKRRRTLVALPSRQTCDKTVRVFSLFDRNLQEKKKLLARFKHVLTIA